MAPLNADQSKRRRRLAAFTLADPERLAEGLRQIAPEPGYVFLRRPEAGLVMVRGRIGNSGRAFNLGEMLVSRCSIQLSGRLGHGWAPGMALLQAELAALGDALGQIPEYAPAIDGLVAELEAEKNQREARRRAEIKDTQVQFFTLVRGEDKNA